MHCSQEKKIVYDTNDDYDIEAELKEMSRCDWPPLPVTARIDTPGAKRFKAAVDLGLQAQGLVETSCQPDFPIETRIGSMKR